MSVIEFSTNVRAKEVPEVLLLWPCGDYYKVQEPADWYIEIDLWLRTSQLQGFRPVYGIAFLSYLVHTAGYD